MRPFASRKFVNGATLKFMSAGGGDKITQLEARTRAYGRLKRIYMECTVSTEQGRTWQEYQAVLAAASCCRVPTAARGFMNCVATPDGS